MDKLRTLFLDFLFPRTRLERRASLVKAGDLAGKRQPKARPSSFICPLLSYKDKVVRHMVWMLKYKGDLRVAGIFGRALSDHIMGICEENFELDKVREIVLVPIPASKRFDKKHPRPQTRLLAQEVAKTNSIFIVNEALEKTRATPRQTDMKNKKERLKNIRGAFSATKKLSGTPLYIVVDDVTTTGATLSEARRALRRAGAQHIIAVTIAH